MYVYNNWTKCLQTMTVTDNDLYY